MKVAVIHLNLAAESGDPRLTYSLAQALKRLGHMVVLYTAEFDPRFFSELNKGLDVREVPSRVKMTDLAKGEGKDLLGKVSGRFRRLRVVSDALDRIFRKMDKDFDIVIAENDPSYRLGVRYKVINPRAKFVWIMHNPPFDHGKKPDPFINFVSALYASFEKLRVKRYLSGIDQIITLDEERKKMIDPLGKPLILLRIPVDYEAFARPAHAVDPSKKKITLLDMGSLSAFRRYEDIISAAGILRGKGYDARVILICKDFWNQKEYKEKLLQLEKSFNSGSFVDFRFNGATDPEVKGAQAKSDFFIFPNVVNIWGMAAFEAMAAGLPVIVSNVTSVAEILKDDIQAVFSEPGKPETIAAGILGLYNDPQRYLAVAKAGQEFVKESLNWDVYAKSIVDA